MRLHSVRSDWQGASETRGDWRVGISTVFPWLKTADARHCEHSKATKKAAGDGLSEGRNMDKLQTERRLLSGLPVTKAIAAAVRVGSDVLFALLYVFSLTYVTTVLNLSRTVALTAIMIATPINAVTIPLFAILSDRVGRRPVYGFGAVLAMAWAFGFFVLMNTAHPVLIVSATVIGVIMHSAMYGPQAAFVVEQFPTRVRYAGSSLAYTLAGIVGGGFAPLIIASLFRAYHTNRAISLYVVASLCVTGIALLFAHETGRSPLEE
jgi:MFS family permease